MSEKEKKFKEEYKSRLLLSAKRLVKMLEINAPEIVMAREIGMLVERGIAVCGPQILTHVEQSLLRSMWLSSGLCMFCGKERGNDKHMCDACITEAEEIEKEFEAEEMAEETEKKIKNNIH